MSSSRTALAVKSIIQNEVSLTTLYDPNFIKSSCGNTYNKDSYLVTVFLCKYIFDYFLILGYCDFGLFSIFAAASMRSSRLGNNLFMNRLVRFFCAALGLSC